MKSIINIIDKDIGYIPGSYLTVYSYGYHKSIDTTLITQRENGRPDYQILYIDKGWGDFLIDGAMHRINEGNIVILYPEQKNYYIFHEGSDSDYYWIHFYGDGTKELLSKLNLHSGVFYTGRFHTFTETIDKIMAASAIKNFTTDIYLSSMVQSLLALAAKKIYLDDSPVNKIIEQMQEEKFDSTTNKEYAENCGMSEYHFIRKFKQATGKTPQQYKTEILITKASHLLATSNLNVSETAYMLGFDDALYFSRLFKKHTGQSPQKYKMGDVK